MPDLLALIAMLLLTRVAAAQEHITFSTHDDWLIHGHLYGKSARGVVLVHGGRFTKESWEKQARVLTNAGFCVLAIDMRGYGQSKVQTKTPASDFGSHLDVLAAVRYLQKAGAKNVSVIGGSMGGDAAAEASIAAEPGEIDRLVLLASAGTDKPENLKGRKLFILTRDDANDAGPRLPRIRERFEKAPEPKELIILEGSAHAQFIFATDQSDRLMREILRFLSAP